MDIIRDDAKLAATDFHLAHERHPSQMVDHLAGIDRARGARDPAVGRTNVRRDPWEPEIRVTSTSTPGKSELGGPEGVPGCCARASARPICANATISKARENGSSAQFLEQRASRQIRFIQLLLAKSGRFGGN